MNSFLGAGVFVMGAALHKNRAHCHYLVVAPKATGRPNTTYKIQVEIGGKNSRSANTSNCSAMKGSSEV